MTHSLLQLATRRRSGVSVFQCFSFSGLRFGCRGNLSSASPPVPLSLRPQRKSSAFTLIELLVVIAIIVILAGLGFAGLQGALESSRKAQARNDVQQVAAAVKAYLLEYGRLPEESNVIEQLTGENSKEIVFFEAKAAKGSPPKGGISNSKLYDPWGEEYEIELDDD
jgi:prepilin-type N-terminal cleavage/methylation domain-containing protein